MRPLDYDALYRFVDLSLQAFYDDQLRLLERIRLTDLLDKNLYLFRAKNLNTPKKLLTAMLDARLSSSEERNFGTVLEEIAIFVSQTVADGKKSSARGIDLEFDDDGVRYLVAIKSGWNWGNSSQYASLEVNFRQALQIQNQARTRLKVQAVLGMCYGSRRDSDRGLYIAKTGQSFWAFLSGESNLYLTVMEYIGARAQTQTARFEVLKSDIREALQQEFIREYTLSPVDMPMSDINPDHEADETSDYVIDWVKLLQRNSGNLR